MYEELIKRLKDYYTARKGEIAELTEEAADAIEELVASVEGYKASTYVQFIEHGHYTEMKFIPKWIPVTERLPDTCNPVLICLHWGLDDYEITVGEYWGNSKGSPGWGIFDPYVTHWMPLPEPPKEEQT